MTPGFKETAKPPRVTAGDVHGLAVRMLRQIEQQKEYSNRKLMLALRSNDQLSVQDRGFLTHLLYGVLRHRTRLDALINHVAKAPRRLKGELREILRIGVFELRELHRELPHVAHAAERLGKHLDPSGGLTAVIHGILARIDREGEILDEMFASGKPLDALEMRWSVPRWLGGKWIHQLGPEQALARAKACLRIPAVELRVNTNQTSVEQVRDHLLQRLPDLHVETLEGAQALRVRGLGDIAKDDFHRLGLITVQGLASQMPAKILGVQPGERVLDACAGMGGKTWQLGEALNMHGLLCAVDSDGSKLEKLREAALARGWIAKHPDFALKIVTADLTQADIHDLHGQLFDKVLLDAPCTGLGTLARHPEIKWVRQFDDIEASAHRQLALLQACMQYVRPGGRLVYSVCSVEPEEGQQVVQKVLERGTSSLEFEQAWTPEDQGTEGFYVAKLIKL